MGRDRRRPDDRRSVAASSSVSRIDAAERATTRNCSSGARRRSRRTPASTRNLWPRHARRAFSTSGRGMAREIHDTIAQGLTGIVTQLEAAEAGRRPTGRPGSPYRTTRMRLARDSLVEARRSVEASVPEALEAAHRCREALDDSRPRVVGAQRDPGRGSRSQATSIALHPEIEVALLRTAQEALANVAKHAKATRAAITLSFMGDVVTLDVRDDGVGFTAPTGTAAVAAPGFGLTAMRQRIARRRRDRWRSSRSPAAERRISARVPAIAAAPTGRQRPMTRRDDADSAR